MMPFSRAVIVLALLTLAPLPNASAAAYKWVDQNGETHYSQMPPPDANVQVIKTPRSSSTPGTAQQPAATSKQPDTGKPAGDQTPQAKAKVEDAQIRAENCATARRNLEMLQTKSRVNVKDQNGLYHRLTEEERQAQIKDAQQQIDEFCK